MNRLTTSTLKNSKKVKSTGAGNLLELLAEVFWATLLVEDKNIANNIMKKQGDIWVASGDSMSLLL
jgi:hypothetical protein